MAERPKVDMPQSEFGLMNAGNRAVLELGPQMLIPSFLTAVASPAT